MDLCGNMCVDLSVEWFANLCIDRHVCRQAREYTCLRCVHGRVYRHVHRHANGHGHRSVNGRGHRHANGHGQRHANGHGRRVQDYRGITPMHFAAICHK